MSRPTETHLVPQNTARIRLQEYGVGIFDSLPTKSALKKALNKDLIKVNGEPGSSATFITGGEIIEFSVPETISTKKPLHLSLHVLFEDEHLAAIHKPAGILVSGNKFKTIANALPQNLKNSGLPDATLPQPVHRLDYATTGVLLIGKTSSSIRVLNKMFEDKKILKTYCAITIGKMDPSGKIASTIDEKDAFSSFFLLESVPSERFGILNFTELRPETGRRHQLRKHLSGIGNPILGDRLYGTEGLILKGKGLFLHAYSLRFQHPFTGEEIIVIDELPERFKKIFPSGNPEKLL